MSSRRGPSTGMSVVTKNWGSSGIRAVLSVEELRLWLPAVSSRRWSRSSPSSGVVDRCHVGFYRGERVEDPVVGGRLGDGGPRASRDDCNPVTQLVHRLLWVDVSERL